MKFKAFAFFLCFLSLSNLFSYAQSNAYTINVTMPEGTDGQTAYLFDILNQKALDSTTVVNSSFSFNGSANATPLLCEVGTIDKYGRIVLEPGIVNLDIKGNVITEGGSYNRRLAEYLAGLRKTLDDGLNLHTKIKENEPDSDKANKLFKRETNEVIIPKLKDYQIDILKANTDNVVGAAIAIDIASTRFYDAREKVVVLNLLNDDLKKRLAIRWLIDANKSSITAVVGQKFTDFAISQPDGSVASFSDYVGKGKYVLVDFWASWCAPCIDEIPNLKKIYEEYKGDNFEILGLAVWDKPEHTKKALEKKRTPWPQIIDAQSIPTDLYNINSIPQIMLFAPDGTLVARDLRGKEIKKKVAEMLKSNNKE